MGKGYTSTYRSQAMRLVEEIGKKETSLRLGVTEWTLNQWIKKAGAGKKAEEKEKRDKIIIENQEMAEKIKELEKENAKMKQENEFLEEAARFFAQARQK